MGNSQSRNTSRFPSSFQSSLRDFSSLESLPRTRKTCRYLVVDWGSRWELSKLDLKNVSVQQPLFKNRCPFLCHPEPGEGSAVPRTSPGNAEYDAQTGLISSNELGRRVEREMTNLFIKAPMRLVAHSIPHFARVAEHPPPSHEDQSRRDETCLSIVFCVSRRGPRNRRSLAWLGMTKERATVLKEWLLNRGAFKSNLDRFKVQPSLRD
jgi:hypothetical protein